MKKHMNHPGWQGFFMGGTPTKQMALFGLALTFLQMSLYFISSFVSVGESTL